MKSFNLQVVSYTPISPLGFNFLYPMKEFLRIYEPFLRLSILYGSSMYKSKAYYTKTGSYRLHPFVNTLESLKTLYLLKLNIQNWN